jgi:hypothetical protein
LKTPVFGTLNLNIQKLSVARPRMQELLPLEMYVEIANQKFQEALEERGASGGSINT